MGDRVISNLVSLRVHLFYQIVTGIVMTNEKCADSRASIRICPIIEHFLILFVIDGWEIIVEC